MAAVSMETGAAGTWVCEELTVASSVTRAAGARVLPGVPLEPCGGEGQTGALVQAGPSLAGVRAGGRPGGYGLSRGRGVRS